ncbi:MAG: hypothetical protein CMJ44_02000 [Pimelobacter sp.]|nr:hypothetical protein [Pimelobacter sp.]
MATVLVHGRRSRLATGAVWCGLAIGFVVMALAAPAQAHTDLIATVPEAGSRVEAPPVEVRLTFTEEISTRLSAVSLAIDGRSKGRLALSVGREGGEVVAAVPESVLTPSAASEQWVVNYRVTSSDGHPIAGSTQFEVAGGVPAPTTPPAPAEGSPSEPSNTRPSAPVDAVPESTQEEPATLSSDGGSTWFVPAGVFLLLGLLVIVGLRRLGRSE